MMRMISKKDDVDDDDDDQWCSGRKVVQGQGLNGVLAQNGRLPQNLKNVASQKTLRFVAYHKI